MKRPRGGPPAAVRVTCAAKVNLGWRVGPIRDDGFHAVEGVLQTISLTDTLDVRTGQPADLDGDVIIEVDDAPVALTVDGPFAGDGLRTEDNLVLQAARTTGRSVASRPTSIRLTKRIPVAAGLGGGSADGAGALVALSVVWSARLQAGDLVRAAAGLGSDVPAILVGGLVHATGRGERVRSIGSLDATYFVLGVSDSTLATAEVYRRFDDLRSPHDAAPDEWFANDLQSAATSLDPRIADGLDSMRAAGASAAFVSGSGPTVVGMAPDKGAADVIADGVRGAFASVEVCAAISTGVAVGLGSGDG